LLNLRSVFYFMLPKTGIFQKFLLLIGLKKAVRVEGNSMFPTLKDGDIVLINFRAKLSKAAIVLANHPYKNSKLIKRIKDIDENGSYYLIGDNLAESIDSRTFGVILRKDILGKVESKIK
jgi:nickel-type superoxide dismutase maturation protease